MTTKRVFNLNEQVTILEDVVENCTPYIQGGDFEEFCDSIYSTIATLKNIIRKIEEEQKAPKEMGTTFRTSFSPPEITKIAERDLRLHFSYVVIEDTIRFKISSCIDKLGDKVLVDSIALSTRNLLRKLHDLNYDYLEF